MAASQEQKVDFLLKKIGYVQSKTGLAEDSSGLTGTKKKPTEENKPSPLVIPSTNVWADSTLIPNTPPTSSTTYVGIYTAANAFQLTYDNTVFVEGDAQNKRRTFIARTSYGTQGNSSITGDWIDPSFGQDYSVRVFKGNPNSGGVELPAAQTNEEWFFDYSSGILNFNGTNVPSGIGTDNVYILGYKYLGVKGIQPPAGIATYNTLSVTNAQDNTLGDADTGAVQIDGGLGVNKNVTIGAGLSVIGDATFDSNISFGQTETVTISGPENIIIDPHPVGVGTTSGNVYIQGDLYVQGTNFQVNSTTVNIADKVVGIATTCTDDVLLDGAGIGIGTDGNRKTLLYHNASTSLKSSENFNIASSKVYQIDQTERLSADTLSLGTGTTIHSPASNTLILGTNDEERARIISDGKIGIATTTPESLLDINGTLRVAGISTFNALVDINAGGQANTFKVEDLTNDRVVIAGTGGELEDDEKFTFTGTELTVGSATTGTVIRTDGTVNVSGISTFEDRVIFDNTNSIQIPVGTDAQKDAVGVAVTGQIRYNTTNSTFEGFGSGGQWGSLGGVKDVDGDTFVSAEDNPGSDEDAITFVTAGTEKAVIDSNGRLGIGITNPTSTLHVIGTANITGSSTFNIDVDVTESLTAKQVTADYYGEQHKDFVDIQVTSVNSKTANHRYTGVGDNRSFLFDGDEAPYIQFVPGKTYRFYQEDSSNTNHRLKFYLESNKTTEYTTGVTYNATPGAANAYTQVVVTKQTPSVLYYQSENHDRIGNEVSVVNSFSLLEHNLGIGTVNPLQALQVGTSENPFVVTSTGDVGIATTNPTADLDVVGLTELDNLNVSGISTLNILGVTGITTTQDFKVVGLSTFNDDIDVSFGDSTSAIGIGTTTFDPKDNHIVDIRGNVNIDGSLIVDGANVGAEITAIGASLTNIRTADLFVSGIATFSSTSNIDVKNGIGITGGDVSIGTAGTGFYYDDSTAKVGIGITTPQYKLDVDGDVHVTGFTTTAKLTVGTGSSEYTFPEYDGVEGTFLRTDGDGNVDWYVNTTIRSTFNATAAAGQTTFNTTYTPGLIDVFLNGVKLSSSDYTASNGSSIVLNAAAYLGDILEVVKFNNDHVSSRPILDYWNGSESANNIFNTTDNVGIGTSIPTQLLDVDGDVRIRGGLYDSSDDSGDSQQVPVADGNGGWVWSAPPVIGVSTAGGSPTQVQYHNAAGVIDGSNEFVFDYGTNQIGIGTTNPGTKLDVRGGARLGNLSVSSVGVVTAVSGVVTYYGDGSNLTLLDGSNIASGTISTERLAGTYDISITGSIAGTNVDTTDLTVSNSAQFGPAGSGTTFVKIDNAGNLDVSGIATVSTLHLGITTVGVSSILDEDNMVSDSDTALATQQSIKAYVDTEIDALSLNIKDSAANSALAVDLSSENFIIDGTANEIETSLNELGGGSSDKKLQIGLPNDVTVSNIVTANAGFANTMTYSNTLVGVGNTTDQIILHSGLSTNTYRSVEYSIQVTQGSNFHFTKLLALHDGTDAYLTEYGTVFNTSNLATFDVDVAGGAIVLYATAGIGSTANYVVNFTTNKV